MTWAIGTKGYSQRRACGLVGLHPWVCFRKYPYDLPRTCTAMMRRLAVRLHDVSALDLRLAPKKGRLIDCPFSSSGRTPRIVSNVAQSPSDNNFRETTSWVCGRTKATFVCRRIPLHVYGTRTGSTLPRRVSTRRTCRMWHRCGSCPHNATVFRFLCQALDGFAHRFCDILRSERYQIPKPHSPSRQTHRRNRDTGQGHLPLRKNTRKQAPAARVKDAGPAADHSQSFLATASALMTPIHQAARATARAHSKCTSAFAACPVSPSQCQLSPT